MQEYIVSKYRQGYDPNRFTQPWGARITLTESGRPAYNFSVSRYAGDEHGGDLVITADPGDVVAVGIRDLNGPDSENGWLLTQANGTLQSLDRASGLSYLKERQVEAVPAQPRMPELAGHFAQLFREGRAFPSIIEARQEAGKILGSRIQPGTEATKTVEEQIELGAVLEARRLIAAMRQEGGDDMDIFRALTELYHRMPTLGARTSSSVAMQAYSTPLPLAFLASRLAGINDRTTVYEPTAGNGALLLETHPGKVLANELDQNRAAHLRVQGYANVSVSDAASGAPSQKVDRVIANPPFGRVKDDKGNTQTWHTGKYATPELDHAVIFKALEALADNGRAVLLLGGQKGTDEDRRRGYRAAVQTQFYDQLFSSYKVADHFTVAGDLYARQGAHYPVDVIVIDGRGITKNRPFPGADLPRLYNSFASLEEVLHEHLVDTAERIAGDDAGSPGRLERPHRGRGSVDGSGGNEDRPSVAPKPGQSDRGRRTGHALGPVNADEPIRPGSVGAGSVGLSDHGPSQVASPQPVRDRGRSPGLSATGSDNGSPGSGRDLLGVGGQDRRSVNNAFQVSYRQASGSYSMGTLVPKNMVTAVEDALARVQAAHGNIDEYVARELGYAREELPEYFGAEQIDAIALAIDNIEKGSGFIIGDQTGIGKGRVNAAIIRWAKQKGKLPVFITMNPELYASMVEDLADIGMAGFTPLPTNNNLSGQNSLKLHDGRELRTQDAARHQKVLQEAMMNGVSGYDAVFTTYKQLAASGGKPSPRREFLRGTASNALFILDESHNAGGDTGDKNKENIARFVRSLLQESTNGVFYSSATYAKRPDNMPLYFRTDMSLAVDDMDSLTAAVTCGGIPMQQAVAVMLTQSGQYIRRERSFEGAEVGTKVAESSFDNAEACAAIMRAIMDFDQVKQMAVDRLDEEAAESGGRVHENKSVGKAGADSTNFTSVMHNVISQSLLAQKAEAVVDEAAAIVARGEKVVIALSNTMGALIESYVKEHTLTPGDKIDLSYKDLFYRYLEKSREIAYKNTAGKRTHSRRMTDDELGPRALATYNKAHRLITQSGFGELPVSPIDYMLDALRKRGITAGEITGRTATIDYSSGEALYAARKTGSGIKQAARNSFNSGATDVLIINQAGSTGINLHSSIKFADKRKRTMIIAQPELDINVFMQTLGRVFRTGQVVPPRYQLLFSNLPAEKRVAAILNKKMGSLNANTTAGKDSETSFKDTPDFLNSYGDAVALQLLLEDPDLNKALGYPIREGSTTEDASAEEPPSDLMRRITGRIPVLPVAKQTAVYKLLESEYLALIAQKEALGGAGLEAKALPLDAKLIRSVELTPAQEVGKSTPFADASSISTYDVKRLGKPWSPEYVRTRVAEGARLSPCFNDFEPMASLWLQHRLEVMKKESAEDEICVAALATDADEKITCFTEKTQRAMGKVADILRTFTPGTAVSLADKNVSMQGIVTHIRRNVDMENPTLLSAWKMEVAVADAVKNSSLSFSQIAKGRDNGGVTLTLNGDTDATYARFDEGQSQSREIVHIATGNILAAYNKLFTGRICTFADNDGNIMPGIVLPRDLAPKEVLDAVDVSLKPEQAMEFLCDGESGNRAVVKSSDKLLRISKYGDAFQIAVPAAKSSGGKYYLNAGLLGAVGQDFVKSGSDMYVRGLSREATLAAMSALRNQGYGFVADNFRDSARRYAAASPATEMEDEASFGPGL